jgi:hypothetical protein
VDNICIWDFSLLSKKRWSRTWSESISPFVSSFLSINIGVLADSILKTHTDAETKRAASVDAQAKSDEWRAGFTPNSGPVINYAQY